MTIKVPFLISRFVHVAIAIVAVGAISSIYLSVHFLAQLPTFGGVPMPVQAVAGLLLRLAVQFFYSSFGHDLPYLAGFAALSEYFGLRKLWIYVAFFAAAALARLPVGAISGSSTFGVFTITAIGFGIAAGLVYWLIAGRTAGLRGSPPA